MEGDLCPDRVPRPSSSHLPDIAQYLAINMSEGDTMTMQKGQMRTTMAHRVSTTTEHPAQPLDLKTAQRQQQRNRDFTHSSLADVSDVEVEASQQSSRELDQTGGGEGSDVAATRELKSLLVSLERFYVFDKYVKTETNAEGRKIFTGKAKCQQKMCGKVITFDNRSRGNLKKHYDSLHKELAKELAAGINGLNKRGRSKDREDFPAKRTCRQFYPEESFTTFRKKFCPDVARKLWNRWFVDTLMPLSLADHPATKLLMGYLCPQFDVPGGRAVGRDINNTFTKLRTDLCTMLSNVQYVATTADSWTTHSRAFLGMTVHWIDDTTLARRCSMLACRDIKSKVAVGQMVCDVHQEFGLAGKVVATTTDNGASYLTSFDHFRAEDVPTEGETSEEECDPEVVTLIGQPASVHHQLQDFEHKDVRLPKHFRCGSHTVNLLATVDTEKVNGWNYGEKPPFREVASKAQSLWNLQNSSSVVANSIQTLVGRKLKTFSATRWISYYECVKSLMEVLNNPVNLAGINYLLGMNQQATFDDMDKQILSEYVKVMEPVAVCLDTLQAECNAYMGTLLPTLEIMRIKLEKLKTDRSLQYAQPLVDALLGEEVTGQGFQARFSHLFQDGDALMATALHPHYTLPVLRQFAPDKVTAIRDRIITEVKALLGTEAEEQSSDREEEEHHGDDVDVLFAATAPKVWRQGKVGDIIREALEAWKRVKIGTPLSHSQFPSVHREAWLKLFRQYNTPLPSSAAVGRLFTSSGHIHRAKTSTLTNRNFEQLVFLHGNMKLHGYKEYTMNWQDGVKKEEEEGNTKLLGYKECTLDWQEGIKKEEDKGNTKLLGYKECTLDWQEGIKKEKEEW